MAFIRTTTDLKAQRSTVSGESGRLVEGSGAIQADASEVSGLSERIIDGSGTLVLQSSDVEGAGARAAAGQGAVQASSSTVSGSSGGNAEADWQNRINQPGVSWYHDFRSLAEVRQFQWENGNDPTDENEPGLMTWNQTDGVTGGGCLEILRPQNTEPPGWWRQLSPLNAASNGRGIDDPGVDGAIPLQSFSPVQDGNQTARWHADAARPGYYGNAVHHTGTQFEGSAFWLQYRIKVDPRRRTPGMTDVGKQIFLTTNFRSFTTQEIVVFSGEVENPDFNFHRMYGGLTAGGGGQSNPIEQKDKSGRPGFQSNHDGSDYGAGVYCDLSEVGYPLCWAYSEGWDTLLYHIVPGQDGELYGTRIAVWAANEGVRRYRKIWDVEVRFDFDLGTYQGVAGREGWNALIMTCFNNNSNMVSDFWQRHDQVIFGHDAHVCPQPSPTALETRARAMADNDFFDAGTDIPRCPRDSLNSRHSSWQVNNHGYDRIRRRIYITGETYEGGPDIYQTHYYDEVDNQWEEGDMGAVPFSASHYRGHCWDDNTGRLFWRKEAASSVYWRDPEDNTWKFHSSNSEFTDQEASWPYGTSFHPELFGSNKPGLLMGHYAKIFVFEFTDYWQDPTAGSWKRVSFAGSGSDMRGFARSGSAFYLPGRNETIVFADTTSSGGPNTQMECVAIPAGFGNIGVDAATVSDVDFRSHPSSIPRILPQGSNNKSYAVLHPRKRDRIIALAANSNTCEISDDGAQTWQSFTDHPFDPLDTTNEGFLTLTSLPHHGLIMATTHLGSATNELHHRFWKPPL